MGDSLLTTDEMRVWRDEGKSYEQIARMAQITRQAVHRRLKYSGNPEYNRKLRAKRKASK